MNATDPRALHGKLVLVCSADDRRNPPTGRRGTLVVREDRARGIAVVQVELEFPQMFTSRAHTRTVTLTDEQVAAMLETEHDGVFTVVLNERLDPVSPPGNE